MPTNLSPAPIQAPVIDPTSLRLTRPWLQWFQAMHQRIGGSIAPTPGELAAQSLSEDLDATTALFAEQQREVDTLKQEGLFTAPALPFPQSLFPDLDSRAVALDSDLWRGQTYSTGTFPVALTGVTGAITGVAFHVKLGAFILLYLPSMSGTSNATTATITGLPAILLPTRVSVGAFRGQNNGVEGLRYYRLNASNVIDLFSDVNLSAWTATGAKGISSGFWVPYAQL